MKWEGDKMKTRNRTKSYATVILNDKRCPTISIDIKSNLQKGGHHKMFDIKDTKVKADARYKKRDMMLTIEKHDLKY
jgi:hypothetical protein